MTRQTMPVTLEEGQVVVYRLLVVFAQRGLSPLWIDQLTDDIDDG